MVFAVEFGVMRKGGTRLWRASSNHVIPTRQDHGHFDLILFPAPSTSHCDFLILNNHLKLFNDVCFCQSRVVSKNA